MRGAQLGPFGSRANLRSLWLGPWDLAIRPIREHPLLLARADWFVCVRVLSCFILDYLYLFLILIKGWAICLSAALLKLSNRPNSIVRCVKSILMYIYIYI